MCPFVDSDPAFDSYLQGPIPTASIVDLLATSNSNAKEAQLPSSNASSAGNFLKNKNLNTNVKNRFFPLENVEKLKEIVPPPVIVTPEENSVWTGPEIGPNFPVQDVIKALINFLATRQQQCLWNYEDITAKVWQIRSAEQIDVFLQHVLRIFQDSLPSAHVNERWAQTALQLGLSCSSRHYAGRSLQIFRALRVPITSRMLSDILSRLVETVAEHGEDMQGKFLLTV